MAVVAEQNKIAKVDVMGGFKSLTEPAYSVDGVHPNDAGHELIENLVWAELKKLLFEHTV